MRAIRAVAVAAAFCVLSNAQSLPWVFPSDVRQRLQISDLVVSGVIETTEAGGVRTVDGTDLAENTASVRIDRIFQGNVTQGVKFAWFGLHEPSETGFLYSGPPLADFRPGKRYLIFLKKGKAGWVVVMPVYALEFELAPAAPARSLRDLSQAPLPQRNQAIAEELEIAAMGLPPPPARVTGYAPTYFPAVFDLLGGCAEPFYRWFLSSPSPELRGAARHWLELIRSRHASCRQPEPLPAVP